jgi:capsule biosynthesis phosphatase
MRICIDIDGVICSLRKPGQSYDDVVPLPGAADKLRSFRAAGHTVVLHTARHMKTTDGNVGKVMARVGQITLAWLARHQIEYDEIFFGKPWADIYIDDNALRFSNWAEIADGAGNLPRSSEVMAVHSQTRDV